MKKIIIVLCVLVFMFTSCTLAPNQASTLSKTPAAADSSAKVKVGDSQAKAMPLAGLKRPSKATDKEIANVQKIFNDYFSGKIKMVDVNKKLGAIALRIGEVPLVWIVRNIP